MYALRETRVGAGEVLARREERILDQAAPDRWSPGTAVPAPLDLVSMSGGPRVDRLQQAHDGVGLSPCLRMGFGCSLPVHRNRRLLPRGRTLVLHSGEPSASTSERSRPEPCLGSPPSVLGLDDKRLHIFQVMTDRDTGDVLCTNEQMLVHVDTTRGRVVFHPGAPLAALTAIHAVASGFALLRRRRS